MSALERAFEHDRAGREAEAIPLYEQALAEGLADHELPRAYLGLGSSLRNVGRFEEAVELLEEGRERCPGYAPLRVFLALWSAGRSADAVRELVDAVLVVGGSEDLARYEKPIRHYTEELA